MGTMQSEVLTCRVRPGTRSLLHQVTKKVSQEVGTKLTQGQALEILFRRVLQQEGGENDGKDLGDL